MVMAIAWGIFILDSEVRNFMVLLHYHDISVSLLVSSVRKYKGRQPPHHT
jgi:hypothetical protein